MTNQNNKLDEILDSLYCDAWFAGRVAERVQSGIRSVTPKFDEAKQAIQALYAPKPVEDGELREQLAAIEHERWADWQKWCHKVLRENNPSPEQGDILERWDRQIETPYAELSEKEKQSDRDQVDRYWQLVEAYLAQEKAKWEMKARIDELTSLQHYGSPTQSFVKYSEIEQRLRQLTNKEIT
jgi:hypothetical protein